MEIARAKTFSREIIVHILSKISKSLKNSLLRPLSITQILRIAAQTAHPKLLHRSFAWKVKDSDGLKDWVTGKIRSLDFHATQETHSCLEQFYTSSSMRGKDKCGACL